MIEFLAGLLVGATLVRIERRWADHNRAKDLTVAPWRAYHTVVTSTHGKGAPNDAKRDGSRPRPGPRIRSGE